MQRLLTVAGFGLEEYIEDIEYFTGNGLFSKLQLAVSILERGMTKRTVTDNLLATEPDFPVQCAVTTNGSTITIETPRTTIVVYDENLFGLKPLGVLYGFPDCCVQWFNRRTTEDMYQHQPTLLDGTGYIPCPACRSKTEAELVAAISMNRIAPLSFPNDDDLHELCTIAFLRKHNLPIGENLTDVANRYPTFNYSAVFANTL